MNRRDPMSSLNLWSLGPRFLDEVAQHFGLLAQGIDLGIGAALERDQAPFHPARRALVAHGLLAHQLVELVPGHSDDCRNRRADDQGLKATRPEREGAGTPTSTRVRAGVGD